MTTKRLCTVPGCDRIRDGRGFCATHYKRVLETGDVQADVPIRPYYGSRRCEVAGCEEKHHGRGYCLDHYSAFRAGKLRQ